MLLDVKKILKSVWILLIVVGVAFAADVKPFVFSYIAPEEPGYDSLQQAEWDYLMKYKMFGAHGISFNNQQIRVTDTVGWFGTSVGSFHLNNGQDTVGGPILIGGNIEITQGPEVFVNGPVRVAGTVSVAQSDNFRDKPSFFNRGSYCINAAGDEANIDVMFRNKVPADSQYFGANYGLCPEKVPEVKTSLMVPDLSTVSPTYGDAISLDNTTLEIVVPEDDYKVAYDLYIKKITLTNSAKLVFKMQPGGRLTRVFLEEGIVLNSMANIYVSYEKEDEKGVYEKQPNKDYNGTLLFYTDENIDFPSMDASSSIQGTFITSATVNIADHLVLAGQLLADSIAINADFDGSTFIYVPFDPPVLDFDPEVLKEGAFVENNLSVVVPISLDTTAQTEVAFNYCFDVDDAEHTESPYAAIEDFNKASDDPDADYPAFYICGVDTGTVRIYAGTKVPAAGYEVMLDVAKDTLKEGQEKLVMKIFNLSGAVMKGNKRYGSFELPIIDDYNPPKFAKDTLNSIAENPKDGDEIDVLQGVHGTEECVGCKFYVVGTNNYVTIDETTGAVLVKNPALFDYEKIHEIKVKVRVVDANLMTADTTVVIPVTDVNENPTVKPQSFTVAENDSVGTVVGTIKWGDLDTAKAFTNDIVIAIDGDTDVFSVDEDGVIKTKKELDFETDKSTYKVVVKVADKDKPTVLFAVDTMTIVLQDVNELPIAIHPTPDPTVNENMPSGTVVDTLEFDDIDKASKFRDNVFIAVGGDTDFFSIDSNGVIKTNKVFDYEMKVYDNRDTTYQLIVSVRDRSDTTLFVLDTVVIHIKNVNETPYILTDTTSVPENSKPGTVVDTLKAVDADFDDLDTLLKFTLVEDPSGCFDVSNKGVITVKECKDLDYEKNKQVSIVVKVEDTHGGSSTKTIKVNVLDIPSPSLEITEASNKDSTWIKPKNPIYTNESDMNVCWEVNRADQDCADTILKPGKNVIRKEVCGIEGFEGCAVDSLIVYYSNAAPIVIVSANPDDQKAANIYTIVEKTDSADANIYVNKTQNDILVTVKDSASHKDTSFTVKLNLETLSVPSKTYETLASVAKESVALDEYAKDKKSTPVNGTEIKVSYPTKVAGVNVTVSYTTDNDGEIIKQKVVNDKGKEESIEVITVSYETEINGKTVTISYLADAATGAKLVKDASGRLMTESAAESEKVQAGSFSVTYEYKDSAGNTVVVTYFVDEKGSLVKNSEGNTGYEVSYTYENQYGNSATQSVFIVLDQTGPKVEIISPVKGQVIRSNFVKVTWTVDGLEQDSLTLQGLEKGKNVIKRIYRDKAGNEAIDSVIVIMKDSKDVDISVEQPVTEISKEKVEKYYAENPPKEGQTFAVSIRNPGTGEEVETLIGGDFKTTAGSGKEPYPGETTHLGPTLALDVKLPVVSGVGGLATLDDLLSSDGLIPMEGVDADGGTKMTVAEYVQEYCEDDVKADDLSRVNLYNTKLNVKIWVYTSLGNYVDYFSFGQDMNDPDYTNEAGMLQMFFELKPDKDGYVRAENGKMMGTGAYLYKVEATIKSHLRCTLPSKEFDSKTKTFGANAKKKGDTIRSSEDLLKPFGYKRPSGK